MKKKKKITVHTALFELQLYWRTNTVVAQLVFLAILFFMKFLGMNEGIRKFSMTIILIDLALIFVYALIGLKISSEEMSEESVKPKKESSDTKVAAANTEVQEAEIDHNGSGNKDIVKESSSTIGNKVGGSISVAKKTEQPDHKQEQSSPQPDLLSPEEVAGKNLEDADVDALMNFFGDGFKI